MRSSVKVGVKNARSGVPKARVDRNRARMGQLERQSARTFLPYLDQLVDDMQLVGSGPGALRKKEAGLISRLRVARTKLRKATEKESTSPEEIAELVDKAQKEFDRATSVMDDWAARADARARRGADSGFLGGSEHDRPARPRPTSYWPYPYPYEPSTASARI